MDRIECTAVVNEQHRALVQLPENVTPGEHRLVVLMNESAAGETERPAGDLPTISVGAWPSWLSLRREDMYDDG